MATLAADGARAMRSFAEDASTYGLLICLGYSSGDQRSAVFVFSSVGALTTTPSFVVHHWHSSGSRDRPARGPIVTSLLSSYGRLKCLTVA